LQDWNLGKSKKNFESEGIMGKARENTNWGNRVDGKKLERLRPKYAKKIGVGRKTPVERRKKQHLQGEG